MDGEDWLPVDLTPCSHPRAQVKFDNPHSKVSKSQGVVFERVKQVNRRKGPGPGKTITKMTEFTRCSNS